MTIELAARMLLQSPSIWKLWWPCPSESSWKWHFPLGHSPWSSRASECSMWSLITQLLKNEFKWKSGETKTAPNREKMIAQWKERVKLKRIRATCATLYENVTMHSNYIHKMRMITSVGDHFTIEHIQTHYSRYLVLNNFGNRRHDSITVTSKPWVMHVHVCTMCVCVFSVDDWTWECLNFWFSSILYNTVTCALRLLMNATKTPKM